MTLRELRAIACLKLGIAKWLFIHIPKNAGVAMAKHPELTNKLVRPEGSFHISRAYTEELLSIMAENHEHHGKQHARWRDVKPSVRDKLQAVAIVRNPWSRVVSRYRFARTVAKSGKSPQHEAPESFDAFLEQRHEYGGRPFYWHRAIRGWYPQSDYVTDEQGRLRTDILRQEQLSQDVPTYFGVTDPPKPRNLSRHKEKQSYQDFYSPRTIQVVADWYASDIELFGFDFDTPATRNFTELKAR
ncbi:MAG: sulfotransferase family 2 domain-containing protein [Pseudomonadota bacterium]